MDEEIEEMDLYEILELPKSATIDEIKKAYKKLSRKWHPDKNLDNQKEAEKRFKSLSMAYDVLSNEQQKQIYDRSGLNGLKQAKEQSEMMKQNHGILQMEAVKLSVNMTLEELYHDTEKEIQFNRTNLCYTCHGKGTEKFIPCKACNGQGVMLYPTNLGMMQMTCYKCGGSKKDQSSIDCVSCRGQGHTTEFFEDKIMIPRGSMDRVPIEVPNLGNMLPDGSRGLVQVIINELPHKTFKRGIQIPELRINSINDLMLVLKITFAESLTGFQRTLTLLDGSTFDLKVVTFTRHESRIVLPGKGFPEKDDENSNSYSDLIIRFEVEDPPKLSISDQRTVYKILTGKDLAVITEPTVCNTYADYIAKKSKEVEDMNRQRMGHHPQEGVPQCVQQ